MRMSICLFLTERLTVSIQCSHLPGFDDEVMEPQPCRIDWLKLTAHERENYYHESKNLLEQLEFQTFFASDFSPSSILRTYTLGVRRIPN